MYLYLGPCVKYPNTSTFLLRILYFSSTSSYSSCSSFSETGGLDVSGLEGPAIDDSGRGDAAGTDVGGREFCRKFSFSLFRSVTCTIFYDANILTSISAISISKSATAAGGICCVTTFI